MNPITGTTPALPKRRGRPPKNPANGSTAPAPAKKTVKPKPKATKRRNEKLQQRDLDAETEELALQIALAASLNQEDALSSQLVNNAEKHSAKALCTGHEPSTAISSITEQQQDTEERISSVSCLSLPKSVETFDLGFEVVQIDRTPMSEVVKKLKSQHKPKSKSSVPADMLTTQFPKPSATAVVEPNPAPIDLEKLNRTPLLDKIPPFNWDHDVVKYDAPVLTIVPPNSASSSSSSSRDPPPPPAPKKLLGRPEGAQASPVSIPSTPVLAAKPSAPAFGPMPSALVLPVPSPPASSTVSSLPCFNQHSAPVTVQLPRAPVAEWAMAPPPVPKRHPYVTLVNGSNVAVDVSSMVFSRKMSYQLPNYNELEEGDESTSCAPDHFSPREAPYYIDKLLPGLTSATGKQFALDYYNAGRALFNKLANPKMTFEVKPNELAAWKKFSVWALKEFEEHIAFDDDLKKEFRTLPFMKAPEPFERGERYTCRGCNWTEPSNGDQPRTGYNVIIYGHSIPAEWDINDLTRYSLLALQPNLSLCHGDHSLVPLRHGAISRDMCHHCALHFYRTHTMYHATYCTGLIMLYQLNELHTLCSGPVPERGDSHAMFYSIVVRLAEVLALKHLCSKSDPNGPIVVLDNIDLHYRALNY